MGKGAAEDALFRGEGLQGINCISDPALPRRSHFLRRLCHPPSCCRWQPWVHWEQEHSAAGLQG